MDNLSGKLFTVWVLATLAACGMGWWMVRRFRAAVVQLMRAPLGAPLGAQVTALPITTTAPASGARLLPTLARWHRAELRIVMLLLAISVLIALTRGALAQWQAEVPQWSWPRLLMLTLVLAWPVLPAIGALQRWSRARLVAALLAWYALALWLIMARSNEAQSTAVVALWLLSQMAPPALAFMLLTLRSTRAAAPWLWPPLALLAFAAILGLDALVWLASGQSPLFKLLVQYVPASAAMAGFALAALLLAWWPVKRFARALARAYARRWVSDLMLLFFAAWALSLGFDALGSGPVVLLPLLWIPLMLALAARFAAHDKPPTLLVLRVFKQDANVHALFDDVIERWRSVGNTVLIAGTDVVTHTLDASDLFDYLDGRLAQRFVRHASEVPQRLAAFDWAADAEGRFRVNECYCHDNTWQAALDALVQRADAVLMDLRGFQAHNAGCRFELGVIARAPQVQRVVVLTDAGTDLATARADAAAADEGRFLWVDLPAATARRKAARRVIAALAGTASAASQTRNASTSTA